MKKSIYAAVSLILAAASALGGYWVGKNTAEPVIGNTFYAVIDRIDGNSLLVSGLEVNDINSRGQFSLQVEGDTVLEWRHTPIELADLEEKDRISITYTGGISETAPAEIHQVARIQLLEDEK